MCAGGGGHGEKPLGRGSNALPLQRSAWSDESLKNAKRAKVTNGLSTDTVTIKICFLLNHLYFAKEIAH